MSTTPVRPPRWLEGALLRCERSGELDRLGGPFQTLAARLGEGQRGDVLRGTWLGHALHPLLTDFPLGCWASAGLLDLLGGRSSRRAAQRLVGLGLLFVPTTAASGLVDWSTIEQPTARRVGVVHALGNTVVAALYLASWRARRRHRHLRGVAFGMMGGILAWGTGYLGGHLSFARGVGTGPRGLSPPASTSRQAGHAGVEPRPRPANDAPCEVDDDAEMLGIAGAADLLDVPVEQVQAMVGGGLLVPVPGEGPDGSFRRAEVLALRMQGG
jgi:uncharacterized membrane protein